MLTRRLKLPIHDLVFERAGNDQITKHFEQNFLAHASPLPVGAYLDIQHKLADTTASVGNTAYWVLRRTNDKLDIVSSCTTYIRDAIMCEGRGVQYTKVVIITDIFTHPEWRLLGLAKRLLTRLQQLLDDGEAFGDANFSVVFSNFTTNLFMDLGWKPEESNQLRIFLGKLQMQHRPVVKEARFLDYNEVVGLVKNDYNLAQLRMSGHDKSAVHVQISPTAQLTRWHLMRSRLHSQYLSKDKMGIETHGAFSKVSYPAWVWWVHDYRLKRLIIGRMHVARLTGFALSIRPLLEAAVVEAAMCGFREVMLLDPDQQVNDAALMIPEQFPEDEVKVMHYSNLDMQPCVRWKGGEHPKKMKAVMKERQYYGWS
ncbi:hypothetical protein BGZ63DRAFT_421586 [Mariannaea sp. PMI_226]|nr:hypothetical protein BGZ63DRAFT_421586 [Mariannaea sp. PMI_226]